MPKSAWTKKDLIDNFLKERSHGPSDARAKPLPSYQEHAEFDESNAYVLERFYTSAGNPVKEILLKLNLPDHRILKDGGEGSSSKEISLLPVIDPWVLVVLRVMCRCVGLESVSIRRIQGVGYGVLGFLGVGTMFDIFQNIHILYFQYGVLVFIGYGVLNLFPLWSLVSVGTDTSYLP
ncbi:hypothetical protein Tco_1555283 [Tanacetum coccineum]